MHVFNNAVVSDEVDVEPVKLVQNVQAVAVRIVRDPGQRLANAVIVHVLVQIALKVRRQRRHVGCKDLRIYFLRINAYLINTGSKLVLIDAGAGAFFGPTVGKLVSNLQAAGYQPAQIDEIYITHMHVDHVGGLVSGEQGVFPNAIVRAEQKEADYWLDPANAEAAPKEAKDFFRGALASLKPYVAAGKFKPFDGTTELVPGVTALPKRGHTPGHTVYAVESKGQRLVLWGDLMHVAAVQFPTPAVTIQFDVDSKAAAAERKKEYADAAKRGHWVAASHLPFPGIGHLRADGRGYQWVPANYTEIRPAAQK